MANCYANSSVWKDNDYRLANVYYLIIISWKDARETIILICFETIKTTAQSAAFSGVHEFWAFVYIFFFFCSLFSTIVKCWKRWAKLADVGKMQTNTAGARAKRRSEGSRQRASIECDQWARCSSASSHRLIIFVLYVFVWLEVWAHIFPLSLLLIIYCASFTPGVSSLKFSYNIICFHFGKTFAFTGD